MRKLRSIKKEGFTLLEMLMVVSIMGVIIIIGLSGLSDYMKKKTFAGAVQNAREQIIHQREKSLGSLDDQEYGFVVSGSDVTLFAGSSYNPADPDNFVIDLLDTVVTPNFAGGTTTVYFSQLRGVPSATGTIVFSAGVETATITLHTSGLVE